MGILVSFYPGSATLSNLGNPFCEMLRRRSPNIMYPKKQIVTAALAILPAILCNLTADGAECIALSPQSPSPATDVTSAPAPASEPVGTKSGTEPLKQEVTVSVTPLPLPPDAKKLKVRPTTVELFQHDEEPIGNRRPLLLLHGLNGEYKQGFRWERVVEEFQKDAAFRDSFKIYYARFDTYSLLASTKPEFKKAIRELYNYAGGNRPITIVALSLGGNLVQEAMEDIDVQHSIDKVITLGTPFHGSPLFCYDWMRYSLIKTHELPWERADLGVSYKLYFKHHPNLLADLRWDNSDHAIPNVGKFKTHIPFSIGGNLTPARMDNPRILKVNDEIRIDKSKFICYGGYLLTPYVTPHKMRAWRKAVGWPWWFVTCTVPYHMAFEHPVLRALNYEMGNMVIAEEGSAKPVLHTSRYSLNDGITPLVSALFLPTKALAAHPINREPDIKNIRSSIDVRRARAFRQIDHITFIDNYRPEGLSKSIRDELAPEMPARTVFDWMLTDLLDRGQSVATGAESSLEASKTPNPGLE